MREHHVRICERLGVKLPGPTRQRCGNVGTWLDALAQITHPGARPATVIASITCGMKVPRSPHAPLHSEKSCRAGGVAVGSAMRFSCQKRTPFPIERTSEIYDALLTIHDGGEPAPSCC
jgi:hypothetical protein